MFSLRLSQKPLIFEEMGAFEKCQARVAFREGMGPACPPDANSRNNTPRQDECSVQKEIRGKSPYHNNSNADQAQQNARCLANDAGPEFDLPK
jgi:hypothetical protein